MKNMKCIVVLFSMVVVMLYSCKKDGPTDNPQIDFGYNYFPTDTGRYVIYEVDSIAYDDKSHPADTTRYQLKEKIDSIFLDISKRPTMRISRYYKMYNDSVPYSSLPWNGPRIWYANRTASTAERVEENTRYIRLVFPSSKGKKWDGNTYNTLGKKTYEIISMDVPETINNIYFDSVLTVKQFEQINFIEYMYETEKYARNVGLVYKQRDSIYDGGTADSVGYTYRQKLVSYGM